MGMLFNTEATIEIIKKLNSAFDRDGLRRLRNDVNPPAGGWATWFQNLSTNKSHSTAVLLGIVLDSGSGLRHANWKAWLGLIDKQDQTVTGTKKKVADWVGKAISDALTNNGNTFVAVEFFAVPTSSVATPLAVFWTPFTDHNNETTMIITMSTMTVDQLMVPGVLDSDDGSGGPASDLGP